MVRLKQYKKKGWVYRQSQFFQISLIQALVFAIGKKHEVRCRRLILDLISYMPTLFRFAALSAEENVIPNQVALHKNLREQLV